MLSFASYLWRRQSESDILHPKTCVVSFTGPNGTRHSVTVEAETLYEAAVLGAKRLNDDAWIEKPIGKVTPLTIEVREPTATHTVSVQQIERWLNGTKGSPVEMMRKAKIRTLFGSA